MLIFNEQSQYINLELFDYIQIQTSGAQARLTAVKLNPSNGAFDVSIPLFEYSDAKEFQQRQNAFIIAVQANLPILFFNDEAV